MKTVEFSTTTILSAAPEEVVEHLSDPANHVGLSPLVVAVRDIRRTPDEVRFTAVERFRFGPLRRDNVIEASMRLGARTVSGDVVSPGGVRLDYEFRIEAVAEGTRLVDHYRLSAPFGVLRFAVGQAKKVQVARGRELARRFSSTR
ncbi:SRPBCC family protein [Crossiella cryophila]|uniref:Polyketide cyclase / dehydrase and lipid transport n=1 Tax=Crossiella cryophila TaxID=43355 RepID=A0A7W7FS00_9PSEU|nr:SRPBCC family protein [Crossiella cryophila]MBB4676551.1 hypothetical protein [Crossiella cryophila]